MFNYNQETIYSLLCAVLPCFIYLLVWGRKKPLDGSKEAWIYIAISFCGMFFLHYPFWFAFKVAPLIWH